jgi:hypothetical protein
VKNTSVQAADRSPAEIVAMRFPADWDGVRPVDPAPTRVATETIPVAAVAAPVRAATTSVQPRPAPARAAAAAPPPARYTVASAESVPVQLGNTEVFAPYSLAGSQPDPSKSAPPSDQALAYANTDSADTAAPVAAPATRTTVAPAAKRAAPHPVSHSDALLNNAQIASIRDRLKLSSYQEQYWPPVEQALRDMNYHHKAGPKNDPRSATVDVNSPEAQRLKSAAIPLIMTMHEEQKEEVRKLARLMGLENLAAQF